jgi:hypothetical protein
MNVNQIHPQFNYIQSPGVNPNTKPDKEKEVQESTGDNDENEVLETNVLPEDGLDSSEKQKGIIRNLLEGHFKGVADVRLRINHFEELSAIENSQLKSFVTENIDNISSPITETINGFFGDDGQELTIQAEYDPAKELEQLFLQEVNRAKEAFLASEEPSITLLEDELNNAFQSLIQALEDLNTTVQIPTDPEGLIESELQTQTESENTIGQTVQPEATGTDISTDTDNQPEPIVTENTEDQEPVEPQYDFQAFIESLTSSFETALDTLMDGLSQSSVLPELSEPEGNGRAYDKFLQIYNQMQDISSTDENSAESTYLDVEV